MIVMKFKSGESRTINPTSQFFINKDGDKLSPGELSKTIKTIIDDNGGQTQCYECYFTMGDKHIDIIKNVDNYVPNSPLLKIELDLIQSKKIEERDKVKEFKKDLKRYKFTQRILRNINGVFVTTISKNA